MQSTQQIRITLPKQMAQIVRDKVAAGEYASESDVIRDGLRSLLARDQAMEEWLRLQVVPAHDALRSSPERGLSPSDVRSALAAEQAKSARL